MKFHNVTLQVLCENKVYKSKTSFNYLSRSQIPTMHCFFGVRHGKGPCDTCTGRIKQGITKLVKTSTEVVNSAKSFCNVANEHLAKEKAEQGKCVHFKQTFHFTCKIPSKPNASALTAVPETRQLNCVCNNGKPNEVMTRKVVCCCTGCLRRTGLCQNSEYTDGWQAFDMQQRKAVPLNWNIWLTADVISNLPNGGNVPITWLQRLQQMELIRDYESLKEYINSNPIDDLQVTCDQALSESDKN